MAAAYALDEEERPPAWRRVLPWVIGGIVLLGIGWAIMAVMNQTVGKAKPEPPPTQAMLLPPPPPPPPPPPEQEKPPEPTETLKPVPVETPTPTPQKADAPAAVSIDAASEAGGDAFGLKGGGPGGMGGTGATGTGTGPAGGGGVIDNFYGRNLARALQEKVADDKRLARQVFSADFNIWIDPQGRVTRVMMVRDSSDAKRDAALQALLEAVRGLDPPPASLRFPQKITVRGQRGGSFG